MSEGVRVCPYGGYLSLRYRYIYRCDIDILYVYRRSTSPVAAYVGHLISNDAASPLRVISDEGLKQSARGEGGRGGDTRTHTFEVDGKWADASDGQSRAKKPQLTNVTDQGVAEKFGRKTEEQEEEAKEEEEEEEYNEEEEHPDASWSPSHKRDSMPGQVCVCVMCVQEDIHRVSETVAFITRGWMYITAHREAELQRAFCWRFVHMSMSIFYTRACACVFPDF